MKKVKLGEIGQILTGNTPSKQNQSYYNSKDIPFIKPDDFANKEYVSFSNGNKSFLSEEARIKARLVPASSILVTCIGIIGKIMITNSEVAFNQQINAIIVNREISPLYLAYCLIYNQNRLEFIANAPVVPIINKSQFSEFEIFIHETQEERTKVEKVLSNIDYQIFLRQQQLIELKNLVKSRFNEMFGNPITNNLQLPIKKFSEVVTLQRGFDLPTQNRQSGDVNVYGSNGVVATHIEPRIREKGIVTGRSGSIGKVHVTDDEYWPLNTTLFSKELHGNNPVFLKYLLEAFRLDRFYNGTGVPTLNRNVVHKEKIICPSIDTQNEFADFVKEVDKSQFVCQKSLKLWRKLVKSSIIEVSIYEK